MKDSQPFAVIQLAVSKYIKESNERFSTSKQGIQANV